MLHLHNFLGHERIAWDLQPGVNLLLGPNGSGKSYLFERLATEHPESIGYRAPVSIHAFRAFRPGYNSGNFLSRDASNLFDLLQYWLGRATDAPRHGDVMQAMRRLFPKRFDGIVFERTTVYEEGEYTGSLPFISFQADMGAEKQPWRHMSSGIVSALVTLTAVAAMRPGTTLFIDEPENGLHPSQMDPLIEQMWDATASHSSTICMATHSRALIDAFTKDTEEGANYDRVWLLNEPEQPALVRLSDIRNENWLAHFRLGNLYGVDFATQTTE